MGLSSSSKTQTTKPVYSTQIESAANNVNSAYQSQAPKITGITDNLAGLIPSLMDQYKNGDPTVNAAKGYTTDVLSGKYLDSGNPYLSDIIAKSNNDVMNANSAALGTRGLTGGSAFSDIISRAVAQNDTTLRYNDYNAERDRMAQAASLTPSLAATSQLPLQSMLSILQAQQAPVQAASGAGASIGGLLGQYGTTTEKSSPSLGAIIAQLAGNAASAYATGGMR